jgi:hypothetical protein
VVVSPGGGELLDRRRWRRCTARTARGRSGRRTTRAAGRRTTRTAARTTRTAPTEPLAHLPELLLLVVGEDLVQLGTRFLQLGIHFLLELCDLLLLVSAQVQLVLKEAGEQLTGPGRPAWSPGPPTARTARTASGLVLGAGEAGDQHQHGQCPQDTNEFSHRHTSIQLAG